MKGKKRTKSIENDPRTAVEHTHMTDKDKQTTKKMEIGRSQIAKTNGKEHTQTKTIRKIPLTILWTFT